MLRSLLQDSLNWFLELKGTWGMRQDSQAGQMLVADNLEAKGTRTVARRLHSTITECWRLARQASRWWAWRTGKELTRGSRFLVDDRQSVVTELAEGRALAPMPVGQFHDNDR